MRYYDLTRNVASGRKRPGLYLRPQFRGTIGITVKLDKNRTAVLLSQCQSYHLSYFTFKNQFTTGQSYRSSYINHCSTGFYKQAA